jgi:hypothetical protein
LTVAAACFYNAVNHTPEQPGIVITCEPVPVAQNRRYILRRENGRCGSDISVLEYFASDKSGAVLQGEQLIS